MPDPIGSESLKNLAALDRALSGLGQRVSTLEGMLANAEARAEALAKGDTRFAPSAGAGAAGRQVGGVLDEAEVQARSRLSGVITNEAEARQYVSSILQRSSVEEGQVSAALEREIQMRSMASQSLQRHGALTTEFIQSTARGEATMAEFGTQMGLTIGKFAGWTAASAAVFGVLGAVTELGKGAIDATSGVAQLQRFFEVNPDQATRGFRQVSQDVNVSVKDVADAQAQFARLYHSQSDSLTAARTSLLATKLDNISAADSYRYLTAAAQGFQLQAKDLPGLLASVNAEQNKLGARVSETIPGVARAAGAVKNAGGDLNQLIAIIATAQRATGQTGNTVGTSLARSATRFVPKNAAELRQFGLDPTESYTQLIIDAVDKATQLSGPKRRQLAEALGGPQLGSRTFVGLLGQAPLLHQALGAQQDPAANAALLERERQKVVGSAQEQLSALANGFQRLGSNLAQSGLLNVFGLLLVGLNDAISLVNHLLEIFNQLPAPVRQTGAELAGIVGIIALMRRFNVGSMFTEGGFLNTLLRPGSNKRTDTLVRQGLNNQVSFFQDENERVSRQVPVVRNQSAAAIARRDAYAEQLAAQDQVSVEQAAELQRLDARAVALTQRANDLLDQQAGIQSEITVAQTQRLRYEQLMNEGYTAAEAAGAIGVNYIPGTLQRPSAENPTAVRDLLNGEEGAAAAAMLASGRGVPAEGQLALFGGATKPADEINRTGAAVKDLTGETGAWEASIGRAKNSLGSMREVLASVPAGVGNLVGSLRGFILNPIIGPLIAMQLGQMLGDYFKSQGAPDHYDNMGTGPANAGQQAAWARGQFNVPFGQFYNPQQQAVDERTAQNYLRMQQEVASGRIPWQNFAPPPPRPTTPLSPHAFDPFTGLFPNLPPAANSYLNRIGGFFNAQDPQAQVKAALGQGRVLPGLLPDQIQGQIQTAVRGFETGKLTLNQAQEWLSNALHDISIGQVTTPQAAKLRTEVAQARAQMLQGTNSSPQSLQEALSALSSKDLSTWLKNNTDVFTALGATQQRLQGPAIAYKIALQRATQNPTDATAVSTLKEAQDALNQLYSQINKQVDDAVLLARGDPAQIQAAYAKGLSQVQQTHGGQLGRVAYQQLLQKQYETISQSIQSQATVADAYDVNPITAAQRAIGTTGRLIRLAITAYGQNSKQVADLIKQQQDAYKQLAQAQVDLVTSQGAIAAAGQVTAAGKDLAKLQTAEQVYRVMVQSGRYSQAELNNQYAQVLDARRSWADQQLSDAKAMVDARAALASSRTTNPVAQARIAWQQAVRDVGLTSRTNPADVVKARADANTRYQDYLKAVWQAQTDTIDYQLQMGDISTGEAIDRLQKLAQRERSNQQAYRQTMLKIHQLQQQADSNTGDELAIGNIKMPTAYEVRRTLAGGPRGAVSMVNQPQINVTVNDRNAATAVFQAIDQATGSSVEAAARAAGVA